MSWNLHDLDVRAIWSRACDTKSCTSEQRLIFAIEFVAMAMAFADFSLGIGSSSDGVRLKLALPGAEPHGAAKFINSL